MNDAPLLPRYLAPLRPRLRSRCGSDSKDGGAAATPDAGNATGSNGDASASDSGPGPDTCSSLKQAGSSVDIIAAKPPQPDPAGGTPVDGTFVLKSVHAFTAFPGGKTIPRFGAYTLAIGSGATTFEQVVIEPGQRREARARRALHDGTSNSQGDSRCKAPLDADGGVEA